MWKKSQPDLTRNPIDSNPFLTRLKWLVFDPNLTCNPIDPTRTNLTRPFSMYTHTHAHTYFILEKLTNLKGTSLKNIYRNFYEKRKEKKKEN